MTDLLEREIKPKDLVVIASANYLYTGIIKNVSDYSLHSFPLNERGLDILKGNGGTIDFINSPRHSRIFKITRESLHGKQLKYYDEMMKILNKNVATADNT